MEASSRRSARLPLLHPTPHLLRLQRVLRLPASLRAYHHLRNGRLHLHPKQRSLRPSLRPLLHRNRHLSIPLRPSRGPRSVRRRGWAGGSNRVHPARNPNNRRCALLRDLPRNDNLHLRSPHALLGIEHPCYGLQACGWIGDPGDGWSMWAGVGDEYLPADRGAVL